MVLDPETVRTFFFGMHDVALIEIVVIRCCFNNNFSLMIIILINKVVLHIFCLCSYTSVGNTCIWILILFVYRFISIFVTHYSVYIFVTHYSVYIFITHYSVYIFITHYSVYTLYIFISFFYRFIYYYLFFILHIHFIILLHASYKPFCNKFFQNYYSCQVILSVLYTLQLFCMNFVLF